MTEFAAIIHDPGLTAIADNAGGRLAYATYGLHTGFKTHDGRDMPAWEPLPPLVQTAWIAVARTAKELP